MAIEKTKRWLMVCLAGTSVLLFLIVLRVSTGKKVPPSPYQPTHEQHQQMDEMMGYFAKVVTQPLSLEVFSNAVRSRTGTNVNDLPATDRDKLFAAIDRFYACYSSGDFESFKQFRLQAPFVVSEAVVTAVKQIASQKNLPLNSDEDVLHIAWDHYNGTNKFGEVDEQSISIKVVETQELTRELLKPSIPFDLVHGLGSSCWEGAVVYQPTPAELLEKEASLRFFILDMTVRFSPFKDGPATPIVLIGYWDPTREDWMPYAMCTSSFRVGDYDTIF